MLSVVAVVLASYLVLRVVWPLRWSRAARTGLAVLVFGLALHHRIVARFAGSMASPEIPKAAIAVLGTGFIALLLTTVFVLLLDAL
ncbi:MAG: metallophosphoesterase, partial [Sphingomonas taxi]